MQKVMKELIPRLICVIGIIMIAWIAIKTLVHQDEKRWLASLEVVARKNAQYTSDWLTQKTGIANQLAEDPRLLSVFDNPEELQPVRSALYEFSEANGIANAYVFDIDSVSVVVKRAGAQPLPEEVTSMLAIAYDEGWTRIAHVIGKGPSADLLVAYVIRGDLGDIIGFAIYTEPLQKALRDMRKALGRNNPVDLSVFRIDSPRLAHAIWGINDILPTFRNGSARDFNLPIFRREKQSGKFDNLNGDASLMAFSDVKNYVHWRSGASITEEDVAKEGASIRKAIQTIAGVLALLVLLIPGSGSYSGKLRSTYSKLFPEVFKKPQEEPFQPDVKPIDIDSLRSGGAGSLDGNAADVKFDFPHEAENKNTTASPQKESTSKSRKPNTTGFAGQGRTSGFGTNPDDFKKLNEKPQLIMSGKKDGEDPSEGNHVTEFMIRQGIKNEQFKLVYQPIVDIQTGKPVMYEVLSRIIDEDGTVIPPNVWLPVVRKDNLFQNIDKGVISKALEEHILSGTLKTPLTFNISGNTFDSLKFMDDIRAKLEANPNLTQLMLFELSSKEIISDRKAMAFTKEHRALGFKFSIDYFGGGADTIKVAKKLKFDYVKIDALRFDINEKAEQKELLILIKTAEQVGIPVIIERVESAKFFQFIKAAGAPYAQGYYFAEPSESISGNLVL